MIELKAGERLDDLQRNGCRIIQNEKLFCFGMDAVLLTAFTQEDLREGDDILDLCSGNGVIPILLDARCGGGHRFTALEINPVCVDMARRSIEYNGQQDRIRMIECDIRKAGEIIPPASFGTVTVNPPYMTGGHGLTGDNRDKMIARHEILCSLDDVVSAAAHALRPQGRMYMVHRPFRLADIFRSLNRHGLEPKRMRMVYPFADKEPNMVLIEAVRGGRPRIQCEKPLIIYEEPGVYTEEVRRLYG